MTEILVSIIIPVFNRSALVCETLESVYLQDHQSIELIIVNDASTDETVSVVNNWVSKYEKRFNRVIFHSFEKNKGKSEAVNYGFDKANGSFIMVLDSDDVLTLSAIKTELNYLTNHPNVDAVFSGAFLLDNRTKTNILVHTTQHYNSFENVRREYGDMLLKGNCIVASTVLMRSTVISKLGGFRTDLRYTHDFEYWIRLSTKCIFGYLNVPVIYYRRNVGDGSSLQMLDTFKEIIRLLQENIYHYSFHEMVLAILIHTRFHVITSKGSSSQNKSLTLIITGVKALAKYILIRRLV